MNFNALLKRVLRKIYHAINRLTGINYYRALYNGKKIADRLLINANEEYFVCSHGIGDVTWMLSFINAYFSELSFCGKIHIVCTKRDVNIIKSFMEDANVIGININELIMLGKYTSSRYCNSKENIHTLIFPKLKQYKLMLEELALLSESGLHMDMCYKYGCFNLGHDAVFRNPNLSKYKEYAQQAIQENGLIPNNSVVLVPFINSRLSLPVEEWEKIADELMRAEIKVYTNVDSKNIPIKNTIPLFLPLEILPIVIKETGCAISGRCGLCDWLFVNGCDLAVIHTYRVGRNLTKNQEVQTSFARKESFYEMKQRCGIEGSKLVEYRMCQNSPNDRKIHSLVADIQQMLEEKRN